MVGQRSENYLRMKQTIFFTRIIEKIMNEQQTDKECHSVAVLLEGSKRNLK